MDTRLAGSPTVPIAVSLPDVYADLLCRQNVNMGRVLSTIRVFLCCTLSLALPVSANATDLPVAILHTQGGVWVNGKEVPDSTAIFPGDTLQTQAGSAANLDSEGSTVLLKPDSVATQQRNFLTLDHGSVSVSTGSQFRVKVRCLDVVPVRPEWTQYEVTDVSGKVDVVARKNDVNIDHESNRAQTSKPEPPNPEASTRATVREGEEKSKDESEACGAAERPGGAGSTLSPKWIYAGAGGAAAIVLLLLGGGGGKKPNVSPSTP